MDRDLNHELLMRMVEFDAGDPERTQHFMKVYEFSHMIGIEEGVPADQQKILDAAAILHDIGILPCEKKYGHCTGKMQEEEGPAYAREMLTENGGLSDEEIDRVCYLIAHHHTYTDVDGIDYRILIEADFLVNSMEKPEIRHNEEAIRSTRDHIFRTKTGTRILDTMYLL